MPVVDRELSTLDASYEGSRASLSRSGALCPLQDPCLGEIGTLAEAPENPVCQESSPWVSVGKDVVLYFLGARTWSYTSWGLGHPSLPAFPSFCWATGSGAEELGCAAEGRL